MSTGKSKKSVMFFTALMLACIGMFTAPDLKASVDKAQSVDFPHNQNESSMMRIIQMERAQHETGMGVQRDNNILRDQPAE